MRVTGRSHQTNTTLSTVNSAFGDERSICSAESSTISPEMSTDDAIAKQNTQSTTEFFCINYSAVKSILVVEIYPIKQYQIGLW